MTLLDRYPPIVVAPRKALFCDAHHRVIAKGRARERGDGSLGPLVANPRASVAPVSAGMVPSQEPSTTGHDGHTHAHEDGSLAT